MSPATTQRLLTPAQAAERLSVAISTLAKMRLRGDGPTFCKLGASVRYEAGDVDTYVESLPRRRSTSDGT